MEQDYSLVDDVPSFVGSVEAPRRTAVMAIMEAAAQGRTFPALPPNVLAACVGLLQMEPLWYFHNDADGTVFLHRSGRLSAEVRLSSTGFAFVYSATRAVHCVWSGADGTWTRNETVSRDRAPWMRALPGETLVYGASPPHDGSVVTGWDDPTPLPAHTKGAPFVPPHFLPVAAIPATCPNVLRVAPLPDRGFACYVSTVEARHALRFWPYAVSRGVGRRIGMGVPVPVELGGPPPNDDDGRR